MKDILDVPANLSVVGAIFPIVFSAILTVVLFLWVLGKMSGGWWKKKIIGWLWKRYVFTIIIELIPFINFIPANTIFIFMAHKRETKIVKLMNIALEELRNAGVLKYIK